MLIISVPSLGLRKHWRSLASTSKVLLSMLQHSQWEMNLELMNHQTVAVTASIDAVPPNLFQWLMIGLRSSGNLYLLNRFFSQVLIDEKEYQCWTRIKKTSKIIQFIPLLKTKSTAHYTGGDIYEDPSIFESPISLSKKTFFCLSSDFSRPAHAQRKLSLESYYFSTCQQAISCIICRSYKFYGSIA